MPRKRKYRQGRRIKTMAALIKELSSGHYVYERHKAQHPSWIMERSLHSLRREVQAGVYRYAKENQ